MASDGADRLKREFETALAARTMPAYWRRVNQLQGRGTREVFDTAVSLLRSRDRHRRRVGADVLGELGYQQSVAPFKVESASALRTLLKRERDSSVLAAAVTALSRLRVRSAIPLLRPLVSHPSEEVRRAVAAELPWCTWESGDERPERRVTRALIDLSRDPIARVRDWACFSLAGSVADTPELRAALWDRVRDRHYDTRVEALRGLARRRDARIREPLLAAIQTIGLDRLGTWVIDDLLDYVKTVRDRQLIRALQS